MLDMPTLIFQHVGVVPAGGESGYGIHHRDGLRPPTLFLNDSWCLLGLSFRHIHVQALRDQKQSLQTTLSLHRLVSLFASYPDHCRLLRTPHLVSFAQDVFAGANGDAG